MINAGMAIIQCLDILQAQQENRTFKKTLQQVRESVEMGTTLAQAFEKYPKIFDEFFVHMVHAGESGGILDVILKRLSIYMEKAAKLKAKVKGAMIYPTVTFGIATVVVMIILYFVIPVFQEMFSTLGGELPIPTQIVITASKFLRTQTVPFLITVLLLIFAVSRLRKTEKGRLMIDRTLLRLPVFGVLLRKSAIAKFSRTMGTMLSSGISVLDTLGIVAKSADNRVVERSLLKVRSDVAQGRTMYDPLTESGAFPPMVCQMVAVGESTGTLDAMMEKIADFYEDETDTMVSSLTSLLQPLLMVVLGLIVGGIVISLFLPLIKAPGAVMK